VNGADRSSRLPLHALSLYGAFGVRKAAALALVLVVGRAEGLVGFGIYCLALVWMDFAMRLAILGTDIVVIRDTAARRSDAQQRVSHALGWRLLAAGLLYPALILAARLAGQGRLLLHVVAVMGVGMVLQTAADLLFSIVQGRERVDLHGAAQTLISLAGLGLGLAAVQGGYGLPGLAVAYTLRGAISLLLGVVLCRALRAMPRPAFGIRPAAALLKDAAPIGLNRVLTSLYMGSGMTVLQIAFGPGSVGAFALAMKIAEACSAFGTLTMIAVFPTLSRLHAQAQAGLQRAVTDLARFLLWAGLPVCIVAAVLAPRLVALIRPEFVSGAPALVLLMAAVPLSFCNELAERLAYVAGDQGRVLLYRALGTAANMLVLLFLVFPAGLLAPPLGMIAAETTILALFLPRFGVYAPDARLAKAVLPPLVLGVAVRTALWRLPPLHPLATALAVPAVFAAGAAVLLWRRCGRPRAAWQHVRLDPARVAVLPPGGPRDRAWQARLAVFAAADAWRQLACGVLKTGLGAACRATGVCALARRRLRGRVVLLGYHRVAAGDDPLDLNVTPRRFAAQMRYLRRHFDPCTLDDAAAWLRDPNLGAVARTDGACRSAPRVAVTFDDGYRGALEQWRAALIEQRVPATVFVASDLIDRAAPPWWDVAAVRLREAADAGYELALDGGTARVSLADPRVRRLCTRALVEALRDRSPEERARCLARLSGPAAGRPAGTQVSLLDWATLRELQAEAAVTVGNHTASHATVTQAAELRRASDRIAARLGVAPRHFAYPSGSVPTTDDDRLRLLAEAGFVCAVTSRPGFNRSAADLYALKRIGIGNEPMPVFAAKVSGVFEWLKAWCGGRP